MKQFPALKLDSTLFHIHRTIAILVAILISISTTPAKTDDESSLLSQLTDGIGEMLYKYAFPFAKYDSIIPVGISLAEGGVDITIRLHGKGLIEPNLWTYAILELRENGNSDIRWGRNNALLAQPGQTAKALGEAVIELNRLYQQSQQNKIASNTGEDILIINNCPHPIQAAIRYKKPSGEWDANWWKIEKLQSKYLADTKNQRIKTTNATIYYYARTIDRSSLIWAGNYATSINGEVMNMRQLIDKDGQTEISLNCP